METHRLLQQASRPHSHTNNTVSHVAIKPFTLSARRRPPGIKQRHATRHARTLTRDANRLIQLLRQDSRRRKNRDLPARRDSGHNRERSRQRLTRTHVTNQQRHVRARIGGRLQQAARRINLAARHRKRQRLTQTSNLTLTPTHRRAHTLIKTPEPMQQHLQENKLIVGERQQRVLKHLFRRGEMHETNRVIKRQRSAIRRQQTHVAGRTNTANTTQQF